MNDKFDFITNTLIIGGGPAGSTLARELNKHDIDNILIEKKFNYDKPCGGGIKSSVFKEFNLPKALETKKITNVNLFSNLNSAVFNIKKAPLSIVLRKEFDHSLRLLAKKEGTNLIEGKYKSIECFKDYIIAKIKTNEKILIIKANYLVGADGVKSIVKKDILNVYPKSFLTNYVIVKNKSIDSCEFYFGSKYAPKRYAWIFPHGEDTSIGSIFEPNSNASKIFDDLLKEKDAKSCKKKGFYIPNWDKKSVFYKNRVFFLGDAAGQTLPFTYEGIYYSMRSARILANAISKNEPLFYEKEWKETFEKSFLSYHWAERFFLYSDFMSNKMLDFFKNKKLQEKALLYWDNKAKPISAKDIVIKFFKYFFKS